MICSTPVNKSLPPFQPVTMLVTFETQEEFNMMRQIMLTDVSVPDAVQRSYPSIDKMAMLEMMRDFRNGMSNANHNGYTK